ncbi:MAG: L-serine ammonia-lyase, iron-sulfur-dependent, subunit alpha [Moritella sp.]|uniref:L-cysteine desulfidase family protein n=1 Tax=Moritella sp. TaxID=78556 RepID=UPI0029BBDEAD|nr:L-serine ammonia-lyase, iron-sulfur-dependent, subunit alpha [Moritella sp.]MDX2321843.1 L-serine ammonia-lyase, iron-sulfur-dependent, subunit alpha [Moritella sp.]
MTNQWLQYKQLLNTFVKPALGCTEPISAAYASAVAASMLPTTPAQITVHVSDNLYKNSMGVFVPGTGKIGLAIAAAVGAVAGDPDAGLEVLAHVTPLQVAHAQALIDTGNVIVKRTESKEFIYCHVQAQSQDDIAIVEISGGHTQITKTTLNGNLVFTNNGCSAQTPSNSADELDITIQGIYDYAMGTDFDDIAFILEAAKLNSNLADEGLSNGYGLQVGRTIAKNIKSGFMSADLNNSIIMRTSAASDARMGGATLPAMSNYGSGNQGIAATVPVAMIAKHYQANDEQLARALILSHLGAIYIKQHYPPLSAFCGNTVTSASAAMAMVYLAGGNYEQSCYAIQNVLSDCSGMVCDGAKSTCAMKVKTSTSSAVTAFMLAMNDTQAFDQGIIAHDIESSIRNIGMLVTNGMVNTDATIINIMSA